MVPLARWLLSVLAVLAALGAGRASHAHEGHDHGAPPPSGAAAAPRAEASSADFEIVAISRGDLLEIYLDTFLTNAPVVDAQIEVDTRGGVLKPKPTAPGLYTAQAPFLASPGKHDLALTIITANTVDVLALTLQIPPTFADKLAQDGAGGLIVTPALAKDHEGRWSSQGAVLAAIFGAGLLCGLLIARIRQRAWRVAVAATAPATMMTLLFWAAVAAAADTTGGGGVPTAARDIAQRLADGAIFVPKATQRILELRTTLTTVAMHARSVELPGRVVPDPNASGLVQASVGGRLSPPDGGFRPLGTVVKAGEVLAFIRPPLPAADATVQAQQARELDQQISIIARKVERLSALQQVIARSQLEEGQLELKGLRERRANLDRVNRALEPLVAPVDGVIAAANAVAGQMAEPSSVIFQIVDPSRLWIEALSFEPRSLVQDATARLADGRTVMLAYLGTGLADRNQAVPVQFSIKKDSSRGMRSGQFVTVFAKTTEERRGIALTRASVLRASNGQAIVYEHVAAERFAPREVRTLALDGEQVLVVTGLEAGRRIVTQGAELIDQIR